MPCTPTRNSMVFGALLVAAASFSASPAIAEPATADEDRASLDLHAELWSTFAYETTENDTFNEFRLDRALFGATWAIDHAAGLALELEAIRSAGPGSTVGVDQNSLVARVRHAYGFWSSELGPGNLQVDAGLIADIWTETLLTEYPLRPMAPIASERHGFFFRADLGARVTWSAWDRLLELRLSMTNGEGLNRQERNPGKNAMVQVSSFPLHLDLLGAPLAVGAHAVYREGSFGVASARNHRIAGALTAHHPRFGAGVEYVRAFGLGDDSAVEAQTTSAWLHAEPVERWLGVAASAEFTQFDLDVSDATLRELRAGLFSTLATLNSGTHIRAFLYYTTRTWGAAAGPTPGATTADRDAIILTIDALGAASTDH